MHQRTTRPQSPHGPAPRSGGLPLDAATRTAMEPRFGHDFSKVRIHTDTRAEEAASAMGAAAYAVGSDLVFGAGVYDPADSHGQFVLAHELAHVVQNERSGASSQSGLSPVSARGDSAETEAHAAAATVLRGGRASVNASPTAAVSRFGDDDGQGAPEDRGPVQNPGLSTAVSSPHPAAGGDSFSDTFDAAAGGANTAANVAGAGIGVTQHAADMANAGRRATELLGPEANVLRQGFMHGTGRAGTMSRFLGRSDLLADMGTPSGVLSDLGHVPTPSIGTQAGEVLGHVGNSLGVFGVGMSVFNAANWHNSTSERWQGAEDAAAGAIGFAGPLGRTFSTAYGLTQLADAGADAWGNRQDRLHGLNGRGADGHGRTGSRDHSFTGGLGSWLAEQNMDRARQTADFLTTSVDADGVVETPVDRLLPNATDIEAQDRAERGGGGLPTAGSDAHENQVRAHLRAQRRADAVRHHATDTEHQHIFGAHGDRMNTNPIAEAQQADALRQRAATVSMPAYDMNSHFVPLGQAEPNTVGQEISSEGM